jgi:hypothetical protein
MRSEKENTMRIEAREKKLKIEIKVVKMRSKTCRAGACHRRLWRGIKLDCADALMRWPETDQNKRILVSC